MSTSANVFANGNNQNCGNFLSDRPTSRVLKAPGGGSTAGDLIFGGQDTAAGCAQGQVWNKKNQQWETPKMRNPVAVAAPSPFASEPLREANIQRAAPVAAAKQQQMPVNNIFGSDQRTSANVYANGNNQNCGNFLTDRPTSRVLKAPGGGSSIVLG